MKKLLAFSFLILITVLSFVVSDKAFAQGVYDPNQTAAQKINDDAKKKAVVSSIASQGAGYFDDQGRLIPSPLPKGYKASVYYRSDGNGLILQYNAGTNNAPDQFTTNSQPDDSLRAVFTKDGSGVFQEYVDPNQSSVNNDASFAYSIAKQNNIQGIGDDANLYWSSMYQRAQQASFNGGPSPFEQSQSTIQERSALTDRIKALDERIRELNAKKSNNSINPLEEEELQGLIKERENLRNQNAEVLSQINKLDSTYNTFDKPDVKVSFAGIGHCGRIFVNITPAGGSTGNAEYDVKGCFAALSNLGIEVVSIPFVYATQLLDKTLTFTVVEFGKYFKTGGVLFTPVNNIWTLVKSICNLFFIAALIFIALKTIWDADGFQEKKTLVRVIIFAVLINFSMYFTRLLIDVSNTAALQVFNVLARTNAVAENKNDVQKIGQTSVAKAVGAEVAPNSLANIFLSNMQIQRFLEEGSSKGGIAGFGGLDAGYIFAYGLMSIIFILVSTVVIGVIAGMLVIRFVLLVVLMMTSPIAYVGSFTPGPIAAYSKMWWEKFKGNLIFLPVLMVMFYITMVFAQFVRNSVGTGDYATMILGYVMTVAMLIISISVAQSAGGNAGVASWGSKWAKGIISGTGRLGGAATFGLTARAGRRIIGGGLGGVLNNSATRRLAASNSMIGRAIGGTLTQSGKKLQSSTFDIRNASKELAGVAGAGIQGGIKDVKEAQAKKYKEAIKEYEKTLKLSTEEQIEKAQTDNYAKAKKEEKANEKKKKENEDAIKANNDEIAKIDALHKAEELKVEAEIDAKLAAGKKAIEDELADLKAKMAATNDAKTKDDYKQRISVAEKKQVDFVNDRNAKVTEEKTKRAVGFTSKISEIKDKNSKLENEGKNIDKKIEATKKDIEQAISNMSKIGIDVSGKNLEKLLERNEELSKIEEENNKQFFDYLEKGTSTFGGGITGRNDAFKEKFLEQVRNKMKDKDSKEIEKLLKDAMKKQEKEEGGEEGGKDEKKK